MASLLDELEEDERKEKEVKSKQAKEAALRALAIHPLMNEKRTINVNGLTKEEWLSQQRGMYMTLNE